MIAPQEIKGSLADRLAAIDLIIFDVDGTILKDTHIQYWKHLNLATLQHANRSWTDADFWKYLNRPEGYTTRQAIVSTMLGVKPGEADDLVNVTMESFYESFCNDQQSSEPFPHVAAAIAVFQEHSKPMIAFSDTEEVLVRKMLSDHNLHPKFESIVGLARKPDITILQQTLAQRAQGPTPLGKSILVIGDNLHTDGRLAKQAACSFLYFTGDNPAKIKSFMEAIKDDIIPSDSFMVNSHGEIIDALDAILAARGGLNYG